MTTISPMNLSVSRVALFDQCKAKYYYKYILALPDMDTSASAAGSFLHKVLELLVLELLRTNKIRDAAQSSYKAAKQHEEIASLVTPENEAEVKQWLKIFVKNLESNPKAVKHFISAETRFRFQIEGTNIFVNGFIDRVDKVDKDTIHIVDYKTTSKPEYLTPFQLVVYSIPAQQVYPGKTIVASYELVRKNFEQYSFPITDIDRDNALEKFVHTGKQIELLTQINDRTAWKPSPSYLCNWCPFRIRCYTDNSSSWDVKN